MLLSFAIFLFLRNCLRKDTKTHHCRVERNLFIFPFFPYLKYSDKPMTFESLCMHFPRISLRIMLIILIRLNEPDYMAKCEFHIIKKPHCLCPLHNIKLIISAYKRITSSPLPQVYAMFYPEDFSHCCSGVCLCARSTFPEPRAKVKSIDRVAYICIY